MEPRSSSLVVANNQVIHGQYEGVVMAPIGEPLGVENGLVEPSPDAHAPEGLYIATTLVRDRMQVPVRVLNVACRYQKLTKRSPLAQQASHVGDPTRCWTTTYPRHWFQVVGRDCWSKAKPEWRCIPRVGKPSYRIQRHLFAMKSYDSGRTDRVDHHIDTEEGRPIRQFNLCNNLPLSFIFLAEVCNARGGR
jgi:hypothetical protein